MLDKEKITENIVPILDRYNYSNEVVLFGTYPTKDTIKLGLDLNYAENGVEAGLNMVKEIKQIFEPKYKVQITSLLALNAGNRHETHKDLLEEVSKGYVIYGK